MTLKEFFNFSWLIGLFKKAEPPMSPNAFELKESMWGYVSPTDSPSSEREEFPTFNEETYRAAYRKGKEAGTKLLFEVRLLVADFEEFISPSGRRAPMDGYVSCSLYGERLPISDGEYGLYWVDPETGGRRISYRFAFTDLKGVRYRLSGVKKIVHDPGSFDVLEDQTTLFAVIRRCDEDEPLAAMGIIHYHVMDFPAMILSIRTPKEDTLLNQVRMTARFFSFVNKELSDYLKAVKPYYRADYDNVVFSGRVTTMNGGEQPFFLFSGAHDKGFPWGDGEGFSDIGLIIGEGATQRRFAVAARSLPSLRIGLSEGVFSFQGPIFELVGGPQVSFSDMQREKAPAHLKRLSSDIRLKFNTKKVMDKQVPFAWDRDARNNPEQADWSALEASELSTELRKWHDIPDVLGYGVEMLRVEEFDGKLMFGDVTYSVCTQSTFGEAEKGTISSLRRPPLYYNYFCTIEPEAKKFRVFFYSGILKTLGETAAGARARELMGNLLGQFAKMSVAVDKSGVTEPDWCAAKASFSASKTILEISLDQYPTAVFQRRIAQVKGAEMKGGAAWALEENMSSLKLAAQGTDRTATVAAIKNPDRFQALDEVLWETAFFETLDAKCRESSKSKSDFSIVVKPSFSFMYSLSDRSTYTDPDLVEYLIDRLYERGYRNLILAEAQSTYACFFTNREVPTLARYVGYTPRNYRIVDLSEDTVPFDYGKTLGNHLVHPTWRDADFRISFAKNKTHSYAFYTLTIKNIYGALPSVNKFNTYHCDKSMGIYAPTIDFLEAFPVHFGLIDAYISADGAFGIFADKNPNYTAAIIGGDDLVAVDWTAASKMGLDPMISEYMRLAVERFGKPKIALKGDHSLYSNWRNVPEIISMAAHGIVDQNYIFGNFLYSAMASMDPFFAFKMDEVGRRAARFLTEPVRRMLFEWVEGNREEFTVDSFTRMLDPTQLEYMHALMHSLTEENQPSCEVDS